MQLKGKVAIVTGGGRGVGRATALLFAKEGAAVTIASLTEKHLRDVEKLITDAGGEALVVPTDVSKPDQVQRMVDATVERFGGLDILNMSAGVSDIVSIEACSDETYHWIMGVNLHGVFYCMRAAVPVMRENGRIMVVASDEAKMGSALAGAYSASKHGTLGLVKALSKEVGKRGITVNALCPGWIATDMGEISQERIARLEGITRAELTPKVLEMDPQCRIQTAGDVAQLSLFLACNASQSVSGQCIGIGSVTY